MPTKFTLKHITSIFCFCLLFLSLGIVADDFNNGRFNSYSSNSLPDLGTAAVNTFSLEKEVSYGDAYMRIIRSSAPLVTDPVLNQYITELGDRLVAHASGVKTQFHFFVIRNNEINAFAFFGGHVGIHTGLFLNADTESEMASVLAHEITHVTQRHLARSIEAQNKATPATIAALLGSILLTIAAPEAGMAALATTQALSAQTQINFTRQHEQEADRIGMQLMAESGFDPKAAGNFFTKLAAQYRFSSKPPQMLLTHPLPESRITEARLRANQYSDKYIPDSLNYQLAKARLQVRYSSLNPSSALSVFEQQLNQQSYRNKNAALYGKALALYGLNDFDQAEQIIDTLLNKDPDNLFYLDTKADLLLERNAGQEAIDLLEKQRKIRPSSQVVNINLANIYIETKQQDKAIPILEELIFYDPQNPLSFQLLEKAYRNSKNKSMEHYIKAESMALVANYKGAIEQLNFAYKYAKNNTLQQARIDARIDQFRIAQQQMEKLK